MFLDVTKRRNPRLIDAGLSLHQNGEIPPNTYVIDIDVLKANTKKLAETAADHDMELYFMSKQLGRIPALAAIIAENGIDKAVAVDFDEGKVLADNGFQIGNIGHLVQPGKHQWREVLSWQPEVVTIFSCERARQVAEAAEQAGVIQNILLKVVGENDCIYEGQEGGIPLKELSETAEQIQKLDGVRVTGVTTFPNLQLAEDRTAMVPTPNLSTLKQAKQMLETKGILLTQINGPSGTSTATIPFLAGEGISHAEPGHGLTGTTPLHAYKDLPELPGMIYVSEVSHQFRGSYQVIAGGYYGRSNMEGCLVGHEPGSILDRFVSAVPLSPEVIDYYGSIPTPEDFSIQIGDTAIYAFRTQIFMTRSHVALVEGIQSGRPSLIHLERKW
ncbi:YhfX family PLP-dependent enzyme [Lentibacillus sediminis]|uniref:YhfX family PLP-dependent enzyme n=1 Tax=Lentibacillus sediminis TaxID=1940529 RepID=UPI000C1BE691|nr:YhfX family PLP-dependent enzyme [Lentibacillus sediminis]